MQYLERGWKAELSARVALGVCVRGWFEVTHSIRLSVGSGCSEVA